MREANVATTPDEQPRARTSATSDDLAPRPFVKWCGGKTKLLPEILARFPKDYQTYHEPFVGGGAVFFAIASRDNRYAKEIGDSNAGLIGCYSSLRDDLPAVLDQLRVFERPVETWEQTFYTARDMWNTGWRNKISATATAIFIFLNKMCFNGIWRVNAKGEFNCPFGQKTAFVVDEGNLRAVAKALKNAELNIQDFRVSLEEVVKNDFVYLDSPYWGSFDSYSPEGFSEKDHRDLAAACIRLTHVGAKWLLSSSDFPVIREIYRGCRIEEVLGPRSVAAAGDKRADAKELLIRNF